jgi:hypothetical protein
LQNFKMYCGKAKSPYDNDDNQSCKESEAECFLDAEFL